jgi:hypothetical protein
MPEFHYALLVKPDIGITVLPVNFQDLFPVSPQFRVGTVKGTHQVAVERNVAPLVEDAAQVAGREFAAVFVALWFAGSSCEQKDSYKGQEGRE